VGGKDPQEKTKREVVVKVVKQPVNEIRYILSRYLIVDVVVET
jgi:hypothetical protein